MNMQHRVFEKAPDFRPERNAMARWLREHRWDHFATATYRYPVSPEGARYYVRSLLRRIEQRAQSGIAAFWVSEYGRGGTYHTHLLIADDGRLASTHIRAAWKRTGIIEVAPYDPSLSGAEYVCKFLLTPDRDHDWNVHGLHFAHRLAEVPQ